MSELPSDPVSGFTRYYANDGLRACERLAGLREMVRLSYPVAGVRERAFDTRQAGTEACRYLERRVGNRARARSVAEFCRYFSVQVPWVSSGRPRTLRL
jgi:hypothetical protein